MNLVLNPTPKLPAQEWGRRTLRYCLTALGFTPSEMRYRKGGRSILQSWTGEERDLLEKAKKKWKSQLIPHHEVNGGDPEQWKALNSLYSTIVKKIARTLRKKVSENYIDFECMICKRSFTKKYINWTQLKSALCHNIECIRTYRRNKARRLRLRDRVHKERFCKNLECNKRFLVSNDRGGKTFCSPTCCRVTWKAANRDKIKEQARLDRIRRPSWKEWWKTLTEEQKNAERMKSLDKKWAQIDKETPEQKKSRRAKTAAYDQARRALARLQRLQQIEITNENRTISIGTCEISGLRNSPVGHPSQGEVVFISDCGGGV